MLSYRALPDLVDFPVKAGAPYTLLQGQNTKKNDEGAGHPTWLPLEGKTQL
jgi:hypothetical protein